MPEISDWQPIETAPKDGAPILIFAPGNTAPIYVVHWDGGWIEYGGEGYYGWVATHWMPLPAPPGK